MKKFDFSKPFANDILYFVTLKIKSLLTLFSSLSGLKLYLTKLK